jgi:hypothetical protein
MPQRKQIPSESMTLLKCQWMRTLHPSLVAIWLFYIYAVAWLCFGIWRSDSLGVVILNIIFVPIFVGPAAVATALACRRHISTLEAAYWLLVEATIVVTMGWLLVFQFHEPDAQDGITQMWLVFLQLVSVAFCYGILSLFDSLRNWLNRA